MSKRKNIKKASDFRWVATPYTVRWAYSADQVPIWDTSRGFPIWESLHGYTINRPASDLAVLRDLLDDDAWKPLSPPENGYPRLVRKNYIEEITTQLCDGVDILNRLTRLLRKEPPGALIMRDVAKLCSEVGPVKSHKTDTLESWLEVARWVRAHLEARNSMALGGYETMRDDLAEWSDQEVPNRDRVAVRPYRELFTHTLGLADERTFLKRMNTSLRGRFSEFEFWGDELVSRATLFQWISFRLCDVWKPSAVILECKGCQQLFLAKRAGKAHCTPACRQLRLDRERASKITA